MKKVILFLAEGFEEVEALTVVDYLRRKDVAVDTVSITEDNKVKGVHDIVVIADKVINSINDIDSYDAVIIPGGLPGATNLRDNNKVIDIVKKANRNGKLVAAICAGPIVLEKAGVIHGKNVTSYPGFEDELMSGIYIDDSVVRDCNIITAKGPALAVEFAIEIMRYLLGEEKVDELKKDILY
ncbi:4-methyl-5(b-hydroxyethyl)-thiazole monophosphate biosynthesis [Tissierella praeacuta DSM 18095]|uniref:4-methyl-5(B-hydroxyethyl)-thiazole monophosphate biosynthesis n=1 Tax=Tissierella praeacuta DSM 18095 TaxID=1123404 RepID=A0A1M4TDY2_9FIRM|nr:DJ-1 family glyoxalase III [Tissierella praeacuta]TCU68112.1 4-methyl-5(b-hydroxyethyl)-thiazole monophosphate biosynthesis [Tissierella praeacuta]SHE42585.1 4-methyl-5(b-hydroxyethyl)-thiazole monophosphate biosynthesis [Tissierella praeacuta DSM 18095]SUP04719.1 Chaperone protein YajL [Tissierella praeacuta]